MTDFNALFAHGLNGKREQHWVMCLASYHGNVQKLAQEHMLHEQTIRNYGKTYRLYIELREWVFIERLFSNAGKRELRQLRADVDYSNWLAVAERVYHEDETKRIGFEQALDFLRAGTDTSARTFAGIVGGNDMTSTKAFTSAMNGLKKAVMFPDYLTRDEWEKIKEALDILERKLKVAE